MQWIIHMNHVLYIKPSCSIQILYIVYGKIQPCSIYNDDSIWCALSNLELRALSPSNSELGASMSAGRVFGKRRNRGQVEWYAGELEQRVML